MSEDSIKEALVSEAPTKARKDEDPDAFMTRAREVLTKQREEVEARRTAIDEELAIIDGKLDRIESYFNPHPATVEPKAKKPRATGTRKPRKAGVRDAVLAKIGESKDGISRKDLLTAMAATDKAAEQSISNAATYALKGRVAEAPQLTRTLHEVIDGYCEPIDPRQLALV